MQTERKNITQITGSNFASNLVNNAPKVFDLSAGADKDIGNEKVYWKYPSGAFGQYYFGALQALSLAAYSENDKGDIIFNITQSHPRQKVSGAQLASAFDNILTYEIKALFYHCIKTGKLYSEDIPKLITCFAIDKIDAESAEWQLYVDMLLDKDYPDMEIEERFTFHRRNTIMSLLSTASGHNKEYNWLIFLNECYEQKNTEPQDTHVGWYCYMLNEYWQVACGLIFYGVLCYMESLHSDKYLPTFISEFSESVGREFDAETHTQLKDYIASIGESENDLLEQRDDRSNTPQESARIGFDLLFKLYGNNETQLLNLKEYMTRNGLIRDGNMVDGLLAISEHLQDNIIDFITTFIRKNIIYRHQMVALRKMGDGTRVTNKFIIEEQMIRLVDIFPARWTSPRMNALRNLLFDLQIINEKGLITELHTELTDQ
ncbi:MAG: hypothetical protein LBP67_09930 [Bacteroidales bacterium]|nr:hypothetical protein [Bacteroidales bacterium]